MNKLTFLLVAAALMAPAYPQAPLSAQNPPPKKKIVKKKVELDPNQPPPPPPVQP